MNIGESNLMVFVDIYDCNVFKVIDRSYIVILNLVNGYLYLFKFENLLNIYYYSSWDGNELLVLNCKIEFVMIEYGE